MKWTEDQVKLTMPISIEGNISGKAVIIFAGISWQMRELSDAQLPKLPLTDKAKRKLERQKKTQRLEKPGAESFFAASLYR